MQRIYQAVIKQHFQRYQQMAFLAGPRQVGKTTISQAAQALTDDFVYFNWDNQDHRQIILQGPKAVATHLSLAKMRQHKAMIIFDEIHKYSRWKTFLKGFFDTYQQQVSIIVTGSSKLDIHRTGGDSLMGRYFLYRIHPVSIAECLRPEIESQEISAPKKIKTELFDNLITFGGFPEAFLKQDRRFFNRWQRLRNDQLFRGDIRDLSRIHEISQLELLAELLKHQAGQLVNYSNLANKIKISVDTVRRWIDTLSKFYYCFVIRPWHQNVARSLLKEPKIYLWDWAIIADAGQKAENLVACHLLKAVNFWTDQGMGNYDLYFLRDKEKREVDFLVTKNQSPWFLVEVKSGQSASINKNLYIFQRQIGAKHAFQLSLDMSYINKDCFTYTEPVIVPALTFLSQLI